MIYGQATTCTTQCLLLLLHVSARLRDLFDLEMTDCEFSTAAGNVSEVAGATASPSSSSASQCLSRKDFPPGLGGSDTCHFCTKRVYVMERLSAEGYFFHRECFRCVACNCTLRLGGHAFDSLEGSAGLEASADSVCSICSAELL